ncbi:Chaperonin CPN60-like 1 [Citrus sinensis]|nr:Chaperonin CPN60-like 1 [Citrus sinensis]
MREDAEVPDQRQGARMAIDALVGNLYSTAQPITSFEQIALFGTAAANGDRVIGELIAKAFEKGLGNNLHVLADRKTPPSIELQLYWGMTLDRGYLSPYFITNHKTKECVLRDPYIMILEKKVSNCVFFDLLTEIGPVRRYNGTDVLIIAEDIENDLLASLVLNGVATATKACVIKPPGFGESRKASLRDIAKFTYMGRKFGTLSRKIVELEMLVSVMSLLYACKELDKLQTANHGQKIGVQAIQYALEAFSIPLFNDMLVSAIAYSAGVDGSVVSKLLEGSKPKPSVKQDFEIEALKVAQLVFPRIFAKKVPADTSLQSKTKA